MAGLKLKGGGGGLESLNLVGKLLIGVMFVALVGVAYFVGFYGEIDSAIAATGSMPPSITQPKSA